MRLTRWIAGGFARLAVALPAHSQIKVVGNWYGALQSPIGPMTLILTITEDEKGALRGELASPDQGPDNLPLTTVTAMSPVVLSIVTEWIEARFKRTGASVR